ncbi:uncharacterized protein [Parasteatoda tepidariorum]|uniref:uncharacterized protein isoform X9 n=1 Tax=Parasteatoda tepidariorum TaxID=114398 RepID=UPI001C7214E2|nr:uncharacterized protein LOC107442197 isoform X9 [Parasteatoda tepidariorum]
MVSKGTSLKRKHKDLFQGGNDNSEHYSTWVEEFSPTNVVFLFNHTSVRKGDLLNICFLIIWPLSKGSHYCQLLAEELAIHKKKVSEVQVWIQTATNKQNKECFLILSGPPGVGKTATVKALSKSLDIELFTWSNKHQENAKNTYDGVSKCFYKRSNTASLHSKCLFSKGGTLFSLIIQSFSSLVIMMKVLFCLRICSFL